MIHASSASSSSSWPGPQPAWPANTRARRIAPPRASGSSASDADEAEVVVDQRARQLGPVELGQHDHGGLGDRSADVDRLLVAGQPGQVRHRLADGRRGGAIEHEAHRALVGVLGDQDDRADEVRVAQNRRCEDELAAQRLGHPCIVPSGAPSWPSSRRPASWRPPSCAAAAFFFLAALALIAALRLPFLEVEVAARLTPEAPTEALGADAALELPSSLEATIATRRRRPRSSLPADVGRAGRAVDVLPAGRRSGAATGTCSRSASWSRRRRGR